MSLVEVKIGEDGNTYIVNKVEQSIRWLKSFEPPEGYWLAFSGGKDSCVLKELANMAGVKYDAHYSVTTVDPPELIRFIKKHHQDVIFKINREDPDDPNSPPITMWNLIPRKLMPPTRWARYCCEELKESGGIGRVVMTGVRWAESARRKRDKALVEIGSFHQNVNLNNDNADTRMEVENCYKKRKTVINPIIDWTNEDVWEFIRARNLPYCELYDQGFKRIGCIGCPMADAEREFQRWPKYKEMYLKAFARMLEERKKKGVETTKKWATPEDVMKWWLKESVDLDEDQLTIFEMGLPEDYFNEKTESEA